jgi:methyltransferase (TIGR00027 family)
MKDEQGSIAYTAYRVMFYVALEQYQPIEHRLIHDEVARQMLPGHLKFLLYIFGFRPFRQGFFNLIERGFPGTRGGLCRKRYIDDKLVEAIERGINAVVILGSGLDTRAYRIPQLSTLTVFEVDLPQTIAYKEGKLRQLYGSVPPHVRLIPIDFDHQPLDDVLISHGYSFDQPSFFIWEGVTQYIHETAVRAVLGSLAKTTPGSRIVFTYIVKDFIDGERTYGLERLYQQIRGMWRFGLHPPQVAKFIGEYSWMELEQIGAKEYRQLYLSPLGITDSVMEIEKIVYAEKTMTSLVYDYADG